jgi:hypothetical protein
MDRNLGATTASPAITTTMGLLYQWGRKDPFPGATSYTGISDGSYSSITIYDVNGTVLTEERGISGTGVKHKPSVATASDKILNLKNSIKNPMTFYYGVSGSNIGNDWYTVSNTSDRRYQNDALWRGGGNANPTEKTIFDPCPPGWKVPTWNGASPWRVFTTSSFTWTEDYGRIYRGKIFYPADGTRQGDSGALYHIGSYGIYWSASISSTPMYSYCLYFYSGNVLTSGYSNRADGISVRCVKE